MKTKPLFILLTSFFISTLSWSQEKEPLSSTDSMRVVKTSFNTFQFYVNDRKTAIADIEQLLLKENKEAYEYFQKATRQSANTNLILIPYQLRLHWGLIYV